MLNYDGSYVPIAIYFMITCAISLVAIYSVGNHRSQVATPATAEAE